MKRDQLKLALVLFILGLLGVLSTLTMNIPLPPEAEALLSDKFTADQIKLLTLIQPSILVLIAVLVGSFLHRKAGLSVPLIERFLRIRDSKVEVLPIVKYGIIGGVVSGVLIVAVNLIFVPLVPAEFSELQESFEPSVAARFLYGGLTEEILMRFGLMTLIVWGFCKLSKEGSTAPYWIGIVLASVLFAVGHFPVAFQSVEHPSMTLLTYILIGNTLGGIVFGWLYWKKGLEAAFVAHIFTHVTMLGAEQLIG